MAKKNRDTWNPGCLNSPLFEPLQPLASHLASFPNHWPTMSDYQTILDSHDDTIISKNNQPIRLVTQNPKPLQFSEYYEPRVYLKGEVQTRVENWHDFFQVLVWRMFPKTKGELNARHYHAARLRMLNSSTNSNRSPTENALTLFDECGAIIVTSNSQFVEYIKKHQWKKLFWQHRDQLHKQFKCVVFGHALYEKALKPYIGITAQCLLMTVSDNCMALPNTRFIAHCDELIAQCLADATHTIATPKTLSPFPLLGMPGWHPNNDDECFYDNTHYFRPSRYTLNPGTAN